jgi:hypothetical protein
MPQETMVKERKREKDKKRERKRERERKNEREGERERERRIRRERERERDKEKERERERERKKEREREREMGIKCARADLNICGQEAAVVCWAVFAYYLLSYANSVYSCHKVNLAHISYFSHQEGFV